MSGRVEVEGRAPDAARVAGNDGFDGGDEGGRVQCGRPHVLIAGQEPEPAVFVGPCYGTLEAQVLVFLVNGSRVVGDDRTRLVNVKISAFVVWQWHHDYTVL